MVVEKAWALETDKSGLYYVTLDKVFALAEPQFPLLEDGSSDTFFPKYQWANLQFAERRGGEWVAPSGTHTMTLSP